MKNKYIFLIIAVGFAAYFLIRPQTGMSGGDAQVMRALAICRMSNPPQIIVSLCNGELKQFFTLGSTSGTTGNNTGGNTGATGGSNRGNAGGTGGSSGSSAAMNNYKNGTYIIMHADGSQETRSMAFPMQPGPTRASVYCGNYRYAPASTGC